MIKFFKKLKSSFFLPFLTSMGHDFCIFLATCKKLKKSYIYTSGEAVHGEMARQRDDQTHKKRHFTEPPHYRQVQ